MKFKLIALAVVAVIAVVAIIYITSDFAATADDYVEVAKDMDKEARGDKEAFKLSFEDWIEEQERIEQQKSSDFSSINITVDNAKKFVYQALKGMGYDDEACAGIMGNMNAESGIWFGTTQGHTHDNATNEICKSRGCLNKGSANAHGLCQWDGGRKNKLLSGAIAANVEWTNPAYQMSFLESELKGSYSKDVGYQSIYNSMPSGTDKVEFVTYKWCAYFEICSGVTSSNKSNFNARTRFSHWKDRYGAACTIYQQILAGEYS